MHIDCIKIIFMQSIFLWYNTIYNINGFIVVCKSTTVYCLKIRNTLIIWWNSNTQSGTTEAIEIAPNSIKTVDVVFKKPFNTTPTVVCTLKSGSSLATYGDLTAFVDYVSTTKNGFKIKLSNACTTSSAKPNISWIATVSK